MQILTIKKPAHPGYKSPERLALNSHFHFPLRRTSCVPPVWPQIRLEAFFNDGGGSLQRHEYHMEKSCQVHALSVWDWIERRINSD